MAKLKGILKIEGTLQDMTFYKTQDGHLVKTKSGVSGDRIANDPSFQRTRENGSEFGSAATAGKVLRNAVRNLTINASDNRVTSRLTQLMTQIKNFDVASLRGDRTVGVAIADPAALALLIDFDFNNSAALGGVLFAPFTVTGATGAINIPSFVPINDISYPTGATHVSLKSAYANVDFVNEISAIEYSPVTNLPIDGTNTPVTLTPAAVPAGTGTKFYLVLIEFFQEVNGVQYSLKNGSYNVLNIVDAA
ncbi:hypothetical protein BH09BAC2_BH09BAC2_23190 [soil metagenome]